jgi:GNAT superfamily N-acetyltransferase
LFTAAQTRGQGVGRVLIEAVDERTQAAGSPAGVLDDAGVECRGAQAL